MKTLRESFATLRQPLGVLLLLAGGGAVLAALAAVFLGALPATSQQKAVAALGYVPGLYRGLEVTREEPQGSGTLRLEVDERVVARFPATEAAWSGGEFELEGLALPLVLAGWGAVLGLLLHLLWYVSPSRQVVGLALLLGIASGLIVAQTLPMVPRHWASFWLRGAGGLPGLEESVGSPVGIENKPSSAYLASVGGRVAEYPPDEPPWASESRVEVSGRGRAWFASYGVAGWLSVLLVAAAVRASRWRVRVPVAALGLGGLCWLVLPFLPKPVGQAWMDLLTGAVEAAGVEMSPGLALMEVTRLGLGVGLGLLPLLVSAWFLVLVPAGLAGWAVAALRARSVRTGATQRAAEAAAPSESLPISGDEDPAWLRNYEQSLDADPQAIEPHPAAGDDES